ncbi:hypothetical protein [Cochleicola gelatinilyticus]|uniref:hypothetical protein n=1 Tax=Cochleicola gelatinilyticus TaxID=1763537 RepID=UPI0012FA59BC|nr:hypothetical protein [Cochleicola gelatinilyticus]
MQKEHVIQEIKAALSEAENQTDLDFYGMYFQKLLRKFVRSIQIQPGMLPFQK